MSTRDPVADYLGALQRSRVEHPARMTTVFVHQGHYAHDARELAANGRADLAVERIGDLFAYDLTALVNAPAGVRRRHDARTMTMNVGSAANPNNREGVNR